MPAENQAKVGERRGATISGRMPKGPVGIVSTSPAGTQEVIGLLASEEVGVSRIVEVDGRDLSLPTGGNAMLAGLHALQANPATEIIVLISKAPVLEAAKRVLAVVRDSDKPAVVCFLGTDQRLVWRAGAIPAARLDEVAYRAAAWVRGWDQALITSRLEELDEQLVVQAGGLSARISSDRRVFQGLFTSSMFCREAQLMLVDVAGKMLEGTCLDVGGDLLLQQTHLQGALDDPAVGVILLDVVLGHDADLDPAGMLANVLCRGREGALVIAHVCGVLNGPQRLVAQEMMLHDVGVILASSNAVAARLAGMLVA
jgi:FdrA protein